MESIKIHGKDYFPVNERLKEFRKDYTDHSLDSNITYHQGGMCVIKAEIRDKDGRVIASGHAYEKEGSGNINKTSYVENCETSAWGRALANFGIGIDASVASADEVANAVKLQSKPTKPKPPRKRKYSDTDTDKITDGDRTHLIMLMKEKKVDEDKFKGWMVEKFQIASRTDIPKMFYDEILEAVGNKQ
jgi:hypothetical protein